MEGLEKRGYSWEFGKAFENNKEKRYRQVIMIKRSMRKTVFILLIVTCITVILVTGCINQEMGTPNQTTTPIQITTPFQTATSVQMINPDPLVGQWGTIYWGDYVSLEVLNNGTGHWTVGNSPVWGNKSSLTWAKNANGTYTLITIEGPISAIISGHNLTWGNGADEITWFRGFTNPN
jgi:hypothetical protein